MAIVAAVVVILLKAYYITTAMRQKISIGSYIKSTDNVNRDATVIKAICSMGLLIKMNRMISAASSKGFITYHIFIGV